MPKQIIYYACSICGNEYKTNDEAVTCERMPAPQEGKEFIMGETIDFQNEKMVESHIEAQQYEYEMQKGKILGRQITIHRQLKKHVISLVVGCSDYPEMEMGLVWVSEGVDRIGWFSPGEMKYPLGFHQSMSQHV